MYSPGLSGNTSSDIIFIAIYNNNHFKIYDKNNTLFYGKEIWESHLEYFYHKYRGFDIYGPIDLKKRNFHSSEDLKSKHINHSKIKIEDITSYITRSLKALIIQRAWRKCRYDPTYKMCETVQLRELKDLGAI
jgi:hypothetical protein